MSTFEGKHLKDEELEEYVEQYWDDAEFFVKDAEVQIRRAEPGEEVTTVTGEGHKETTNTAEKGDYLVRNPDGEEYVITKEFYHENYERLAKEEPTTEKFIPHRSIKDAVLCIQIDEDLSFEAPWGEKMRIKEGGYLVIQDLEEGDIYGVQEEEFEETYTPKEG